MWVASSDLPRSAGHPFYERLTRVLDEAAFDTFVEEQCAMFYTDGVGRPSLAPGRYFRLLLLGYLLRRAGLGTGDCVAGGRLAGPARVPRRRAAGSPTGPLDPGVAHAPADRRRDAPGVFTWVLKRLADAGLVRWR